jgi:alpha-beta hydrolase superfamily lysophospholipase
MTNLPIENLFVDQFGVEIVFYEWPVSEPKAVIQIAHGQGEHARRYDHMASIIIVQALPYTRMTIEDTVRPESDNWKEIK